MNLRFLRGACMAALFIVLAMAPAPAGAQGWQPSITWNTYLGGGGRLTDGGVDPAPFLDEVTSLALGPEQRPDSYVSGRTGARTFPADGGADAGFGGNDAFVARLSGEAHAEPQVVRWARVFGGSAEDVATRVVRSPTDGALYVVGTTQSQAMFSAPSVAATVVPTYTWKGGQDAFLARIEPDGRLGWFMYLGGSGNDQGYDVALGPEGSNAVYVVGATAGTAPSTVFPPNTPESNVRYRTGVSEGFVSRVDVSSPDSPSVRWTRIIGSDEIDAAYTVTVLGSLVFVGGIMGSHVEGLTSLKVWGAGDDDGFVARLRDTGTTGEFDWFTYVGESEEDEVRSILVRPNGNLALVGNTNSPGFPASGRGNDYDVFVLRMNARGIVEGPGVAVGGSRDEKTEGQAAIDAWGNIHVAGRTESLAGSGLARNAFDAELASGPNDSTDGFVAMVNADVSQTLSASYVGGIGTGGESELVRALAAGSLGQVTFGGRSNARDWFKVQEGAYLTPVSGLEGFVIRAEMDLTAPVPGEVTASYTPGAGLRASWRDFTDPQTGIIGYEWGIGTSLYSTDVQGFQPLSASVTSVTLSDFQVQSQLRYYFSVKARNGVGREHTVSQEIVIGGAGADAGTPDGGADAGTPGGGPDAGTDGGLGDDGDGEGDAPPLGWSCASGGSTGALALSGLLVLALLLAMRRERSEAVRARTRGGR